MDLSSLPESQQQQLQKLQQQFEEHQRQQQQQKQIQEQQQHQQQQIQAYSNSQPYDPTQVQSYDQSYYAYYQSQNPQQQHHQQQQQQQQQQYGYYQTDYNNAYQAQQQSQPQNSQIEPTPLVYSQGVSISNEAKPRIVESAGELAAVAAQVQNQSAYYPQPVPEAAAEKPPPEDQQSSAGGLNQAAAAAIAALSQLTQFAGTMDAAERAMAGLQGLPWHGRGGGGYGPMMGPGPGHYAGPELMHRGSAGRFPHRGGGGRRGGGPFRGGPPGNFGNRPLRSSASGSPSRGRGRGRGRGGPSRSHGASSSSNPEPEADSKKDNTEPSAGNLEAPVHGNAAPNPKPPNVVMCELCKVDCNSLEILEQHKNGKKHKKNLEKSGMPITETPYKQKPVSHPNPEVTLPPENANESEVVPLEAVNGENKVEIDQNNDQAEHQVRKPSVNPSDNPRRGTKRKMRGGRGGKRLRTSDSQRGAGEPPKPKVVIPVVCDLCNVKCDTQEVFDKHLSGKKHISKLKRYEGHHATYGPEGLQALYPPNPLAQSAYPQGSQQQTYYGPQGPYPPPAAYVPPQAHYAALAGTGVPQTHNPQVS